MSWALWLLAPLAVPVLVALFTWWRRRPRRVPPPDAAMRSHLDFLDALVVPARGKRRVERP